MPSGYIDVPKAMEMAKKIVAEKEEVYERLDIVRADLRNAVKLKETTPEQTAWIEENFPVRQRKAKKP